MVSVSLPHPKNVIVETFFFKFDLRVACLVTSGLGMILSIIMIGFGVSKLVHECDLNSCDSESDPLPTPVASFFKFMIALHAGTFFAELCLLLGCLLRVEALLDVWLAWPTGLSYIYSGIFGSLAYKDFAFIINNMKPFSLVGLVFSLIGVIIYLGYLMYAWLCVYSFAKKVSQS